MAYEDIEDSSSWNGYIILILSIGMPYYQGRCNTNHRQVSSAQTNQTQVLTWEKHISTTLALVDLGACSWLGWIALETSFLESPRSLKKEFRVKSYGVFCEVTYVVSRSYDSAMNFHSSATPVQVIMASFWTTKASLCGVAINTHHTPPGVAAEAPTIPNPSQAICELSLTTLIVRVSD